MDMLSFRIQNGVEFYTLMDRMRQVEGWLHPLEGYTLMNLAQLGPGVGEIVEIGSYMGRSTCWLACGSKKARREKVTTVDHFKGSAEHQEGGFAASPELSRNSTTYDAFQKNIQALGVADHVTPLVSSSAEAAAKWGRDGNKDKGIRLLFIDGDHSYQGAMEDFSLWSPHVAPWGMVVFHDYGNPNFPGVAQCYDEILASDTTYREIYRVMSLRALQKTA